MSVDDPYVLGWTITHGLGNQQEESGWQVVEVASHPPIWVDNQLAYG